MVASAGHDLRFGQRLRQCLKPFFTVILTLSALSAIAGPAHAQPATCDPLYWNAMKAKGWAEAQREITQNQNLIYKADSILEYTCFDRYLQSLAQNAQYLFSDNSTSWPGVVLKTNMVNALNILVASSLSAYITGNFDHTYLGGRDTNNYTPGTASGGNAVYNCNVMDQVWRAAKCLNFVDEPSLDDFFYLETYDGFDPRGLPTACVADSRFAAQLSLATNDADQYQEETWNMYATFFDTTSCGAIPVPTGVTVTRNGITAYEEHICANPGCAYDRSGACTTSPP